MPAAALPDRNSFSPRRQRMGDHPVAVQHHDRFIERGLRGNDCPIRAPQHPQPGNGASWSTVANTWPTTKLTPEKSPITTGGDVGWCTPAMLIRLERARTSAGRRQHVDHLRHGTRTEGAVRIGRRRCTYPELERLRCGLEPSRLVAAEAVLTGLDHGERPPGPGWPSAAFGTLNVMNRDSALARMVTVPSVVPEALMKRWPKPCTWINVLHAGAIWKLRVGCDAAVEVVAAAGSCTYTSISCAPSGLPNVADWSRFCTRKMMLVPSSSTWNRCMSHARRGSCPTSGRRSCPGPLSSPSGSVTSSSTVPGTKSNTIVRVA